jgi:hypothetical protein
MKLDHLPCECGDTVDVCCIALSVTWLPFGWHVGTWFEEGIRLIVAVEVLDFSTASEAVNAAVDVTCCFSWSRAKLEAEAEQALEIPWGSGCGGEVVACGI